MATTATPTQRLVARILADRTRLDLDTEVARRRKDGDSWQSIVHWIRDTTDETVTSVTLASWYNSS